MNLTKGKLSKLFNTKKQSHKKYNNNKNKTKNNTFRKKVYNNLAIKTLKQIKYHKIKGGGEKEQKVMESVNTVIDYLTDKIADKMKYDNTSKNLGPQDGFNSINSVANTMGQKTSTNSTDTPLSTATPEVQPEVIVQSADVVPEQVIPETVVAKPEQVTPEVIVQPEQVTPEQVTPEVIAPEPEKEKEKEQDNTSTTKLSKSKKRRNREAKSAVAKSQTQGGKKHKKTQKKRKVKNIIIKILNKR